MGNNVAERKLDVLICDGNKKLLGSGVFFVPKNYKNVFILTAAHLFRDKDSDAAEEVTLNIYSPLLRNIDHDKGKTEDWGKISNVECSIHTTDETLPDSGELIILIHSEYDPKNQRSAYDFAVLRMEREEWMNEIPPFTFPSKFVAGISLSGIGYPKGTESERVGKYDDFYSAGLFFECVSEYMDNIIPKITVKHNYSDYVDLEGYSGTGVFDEQGRLYGVVSRKVGNDESPNACIVSGWTGFEKILKVFGWRPPAEAFEEEVLEIDLKVQGHWLLNRDTKARGMLDDHKVVNLASLLAGMTDAYVVILATTWRSGIASALEKLLNEFVGRNNLERGDHPFSKWRELTALSYSSQSGEGVVLNIGASRQDILPRIEEILVRHEREKVPLIVNIWSEKPEAALDTIFSIYENPKLQNRADYISMIDYSAKQAGGMLQTTETANDYLKQLEEKFVGYKSARSSKVAVQRWFGAQSEAEIENLFKEDILYSMLEQDEIDNLAVHLWGFIKDCFMDENYTWKAAFQKMKVCCSEHTGQLLDVLEGKGEMRDSIDTLSPTDIQIWADLATAADFERDIEKIERRQDLYWIAIMRNVNGCEYVMRERLKRQNQRFVSKLLNRVPDTESDEIIEARANYIRQYIRTK